MASKADEFRRRAAQYRDLAEGAARPYDREHWRRLAEYWLEMAAAEEAVTDEPAIARRRRARLASIPEDDVVFRHACKMGLEGIVSKRLGSRYTSGRSPDWLKFKNPEAPAVRREAEEDWGR